MQSFNVVIQGTLVWQHGHTTLHLSSNLELKKNPKI